MTPTRWWLTGAAAPEVIAGIPASHRIHCLALPDRPALQRAMAAASGRTGQLPAERILLLATNSPWADAHEAALREALVNANRPFQVIHPPSAGWLPAVLSLMGVTTTPERPIYRPGTCERCADPACEHQLFRRLLEERRAP
jgi:hypothetical protein